jgi:hypothetical protein
MGAGVDKRENWMAMLDVAPSNPEKPSFILRGYSRDDRLPPPAPEHHQELEQVGEGKVAAQGAEDGDLLLHVNAPSRSIYPLIF